jgi:outer membrane protein TolC
MTHFSPLSGEEDVPENYHVLAYEVEEVDGETRVRLTQDNNSSPEAAEHSLELSNNRYKGGVANYLEVTTAQSAALSDEVTAVNLLKRRMTSSVLLIKAIGGGWNASQIPPI